jgi:hypothetical protein
VNKVATKKQMKIQIENLTIELTREEYPSDPRKEFDHFAKMICCHRRYKLGDEQTDHDGIQAIIDDKDNICLPLYLYDHSGITMNTTGFSCPWDSGMVGVIYVSKADIRKEYGTAGKVNIEKARELMQCEVREYDQHLTGDVWNYAVKDAEGNVLDSCCGFYGEEYAEQEARSTAAHCLQNCASEANCI